MARSKVFFLFSITFFSFSIGYQFWLLSQKNFSRPSKMKTRDYRRLKTVFRTGPEVRQNIEFAFSKDLKEFWLASNTPGEGVIKLTLSSIKDETLADEEVEIQTQGFYDKHFAHFDSFRFSKGDRIIPGLYQVRVEFTPRDTLWQKIYGSGSFTKTQKILYGTHYKDVFYKRLKAFKNKKKRKKILFTDEIKQKYATLEILFDQAQALFQQALKMKSKQSAVRFFEKNYTKRVGNFLSRFLVETEAQSTKLALKYPEQGHHFRDLVKQTKRMAPFLMEQLDSLKKTNWKKRRSFEKSLNLRLADFKIKFFKN